MNATVRCVTCQRLEKWRLGNLGTEIEVVAPGGVRRAPEAVPVHLVRALLRARRGESGPVVGTCLACGHPMTVLDGTWKALPSWTVESNEGAFTFAEQIEGPNGRMSEDDVVDWLKKKSGWDWSAKNVVAQFHSLMLLVYFIPIFLWVIAVIFTGAFILAALPYFGQF